MKVTIYGWNELNECCTNLFTSKVDKDLYLVVDEMTQEIISKRTVDRVYAEGRWFLSANEAKKAIIDALQSGINWRTTALEKIVKQKNPS